MPQLLNKIDIIESLNTNKVKLICNTTANPDKRLIYEWYMNGKIIAGNVTNSLI